MGVIGWIGRHFVLTLVIVAAVAGYIYRDELNEELKLQEFAERYDLARYWPAWSPQPLTLEKEEGETPAATDSAATDTPAPAASAPAAEKPEGETTAAPQPAAEERTAEAPAVAAETAPATEPAAEGPAEPAAPAPQPAPAPAPAPKPAAAPAPAPAPTPAPSSAAAPVDEALRAGWMAARKAFWDGDVAAAEAKYIDLMAAHAGEPDLAGELGNLYLHQGKRDEAAAMFLEAGRRMLRGPHLVRANTVIAILNGLAPERADDLRRDLFDHINKQQAPAAAAGNSQ